jgi:two-component system chemotaxis response regulator CheY
LFHPSPKVVQVKILLLEDEPRAGNMLLEYMRRWRMDAVLTDTPQAAVEALESGTFDLLITDLVMPQMSGTELARILRRSEQYRDLPVLMISGQAQKQDVIEATETGISGFIAKPFRPNDLKRRIQTILRERRRLTREREVLQVWADRTPDIQGADKPQIIFGEPIAQLDDLHRSKHRSIATYLHHARVAIRQINEHNPGVDVGYVLEDNTLDIILPLVRHAAKKWVKLILLSTRCAGKPLLFVRLYTINRREDLQVFLVYDRIDELTEEERSGLKHLGVKMLRRSNLSVDRLAKLFDHHLVQKLEGRPASEHPVKPADPHRRIMADLEAMASLPMLPQVYRNIITLSDDPQSDIKDWIRSVQVDPLTAAVIIRHANSLSYGFSGRVVEIDRAVILLGKATVKGLVASDAMRQAFTAVQEQGFVLEDFWLHNLSVGFAAYILSMPVNADASVGQQKSLAALDLPAEVLELLRKVDLPKRLKLDYDHENPFVGGLMHDIGKGVMVHSYPGLFGLLTTALERDAWNIPMAVVEQEIAGGLTHTIVGEILARNWGLEEEVCQAILHHHNPEVDHPFPFLIGAADVIGQALYPFPRISRFPVAEALEAGHLERVANFLPTGFCDNPLLTVDEFTTMANAIAPKVRYLTDKMRTSV